MKEIKVHMTWKNSVTLEVPDDFEVPDNLDGFSEEMLDAMDTSGAELTDWE